MVFFPPQSKLLLKYSIKISLCSGDIVSLAAKIFDGMNERTAAQCGQYSFGEQAEERCGVSSQKKRKDVPLKGKLPLFKKMPSKNSPGPLLCLSCWRV